jgi:hypothetical protein
MISPDCTLTHFRRESQDQRGTPHGNVNKFDRQGSFVMFFDQPAAIHSDKLTFLTINFPFTTV